MDGDKLNRTERGENFPGWGGGAGIIRSGKDCVQSQICSAPLKILQPMALKSEYQQTKQPGKLLSYLSSHYINKHLRQNSSTEEAD